MSAVEFDSPQAVLASLSQIDTDLANRQNEYEAAAEGWFTVKRDREYEWAKAFVQATGPVPARKAAADMATARVGVEAEARFEALKAVVRVLETRASIQQSILKAHTGASFRRNG
jgi:hypothetical protein